MLGAGAAPAGIAAAGYGLSSSATAPQNAVLPDPQSGLPQTGRAIDPATGDYILTADGRTLGMSTAQQLVQLAISTTLGSSAVASLGQALSAIKEKRPGFQRQAATAVQAALANAISSGVIALLSVKVIEPKTNPDAAVIEFVWKDLTTGIVQPPQQIGT